MSKIKIGSKYKSPLDETVTVDCLDTNNIVYFTYDHAVSWPIQSIEVDKFLEFFSPVLNDLNSSAAVIASQPTPPQSTITPATTPLPPAPITYTPTPGYYNVAMPNGFALNKEIISKSWDELLGETSTQKCDCGSEKTYGPNEHLHSNWCQTQEIK